MAWESLTGKNEYWLDADGEDVIAEAVLLSSHTLQNMSAAFELVQREYSDMISWMGKLPLTVIIGKLVFVHAGFDLSLHDPIKDTSDHDKYWMREEYWYNVQPVFAHNPLDYAIVTGHTPTRGITGLYANGKADINTKRNRVASPTGVLTVQYEDEYARFFIDGGNHGGPADFIGNIAVFDADTGMLIEVLEDTI